MFRSMAPVFRALLVSTMLVSTALVLTACQREQPAQGKATPDAPVLELRIEPGFSVADNSGAVSYDGIVGNAATRTRLNEALRLAYGGRGTGEVKIDALALPAPWTDGMGMFLQTMAPITGASVRFEGNRAVLTGNLDPGQRKTLRAAAEKAFPGVELQGLFEVADAAEAALATAAIDKASEPAKLAKSLNQLPLRFEEGGGNVSTDSLTLVASAAEAIRKAPPGTRLLIVGPVTASSDSSHDVFLSKQRAEALKAQLILNGVSPAAIVTRGWGQNPDGSAIEGAKVPPEGAAMRFELLQ